MAEYPRLIKGKCWDRVICATSPTEGFVVCYFGKSPPEYTNNVAQVSWTWAFSDNSETLSGPVGGYEYTLNEPSWFEKGWEVLKTGGAWCECVAGAGPCTVPKVYRRKVIAKPEAKADEPKTDESNAAEWHFACQPEDFDFQRILREAPAAARVVRVRLLGLEIVAYRSEAYERALKALGRKIGIKTMHDSSYRIFGGELLDYRLWEAPPRQSGPWHVTAALPFDRSPYAQIVKWFADADAAEAKAKAEAERKARRVEVSITTT